MKEILLSIAFTAVATFAVCFGLMQGGKSNATLAELHNSCSSGVLIYVNAYGNNPEHKEKVKRIRYIGERCMIHAKLIMRDR